MTDDAVMADIVVPATHPSLSGHFPGNPVVPAVVLLDEILAAIRTRGDFELRSIPSAKFLLPVRPDERIALSVHFTADSTLWRARFQGLRDSALVFEGSFVIAAQSAT